MRYFLSVLILVLVSFNAKALVGTAVIGAATVNPGANAVLASSGAINNGGGTGQYLKINFACANQALLAASTFAFQTLNGSSVVQSSVYMVVPISDTRSFNPDISFNIPNGWSLRIIATAAITGTVQCSIFYAPELNN